MWGYRVGMDAPSALNVDERHDDGKQFEVMKTQNYTAARHLHKVFCNVVNQTYNIQLYKTLVSEGPYPPLFVFERRQSGWRAAKRKI